MFGFFKVYFVYYELIFFFAGNPLSQDILNIYQEPDGTRKLLNYMLDNLAGKGLGCFASQSSFLFKKRFIECIVTSTNPCFALFPVHPEQLPQRPWITLKERDQMIPAGQFIRHVKPPASPF